MALNEKTISLILSLDDSEFAARMEKAPGRFKQLEDAAGASGRSVSAAGGILSAFGGVVAGVSVGALARDLVEAGMAAERMRNAMASATGSLTQGAAEMDFVRSEANRLGLDLQKAASDYARLTASAQGTALQGEETRRIFSAVSEASVALGLSAEETSGALTAIQQMISKGTVSAEELRGQLGERLPGAFNVAARAMGVTTAELGKMLEKGQVMASDFLPKFATELPRAFRASSDALDSAQASANRFNTALFDLKVSVMEQGGLDTFNSLAGAAITVVNGLKQGLRLIAETKLAWGTWFQELGVMMDSGPGFQRWFTAAGRAEIKAEIDALEQLYDYSMVKIAERFGNPVKAIGSPMEPGAGGGGGGGGGAPGENARPSWATSPTSKSFFNETWDSGLEEIAYKNAQKFKLRVDELGDSLVTSWQEKITSLGAVGESGLTDIIDSGEGFALGKRTGSLLGPVDLLSSVAEIEQAQKRDSEYAEERLRLAQETSTRISAVQAETSAARLSFLGEEAAALDVRYQHEFDLLDQEYVRKIDNAHRIGMDTLLIEQEYAMQREQLEYERSERLAGVWWNSAQTYINFAQQMTTMGMQMLLFEEEQKNQIGKRMLATSIRFIAQGLQQYMFSKAKEHVLNAASAAGKTATDTAAHTANLTMLEIEAAAWAAYYAAHCANPVGAAIYGASAAAMTAVAVGVVPAAIASVNAVGATSIASELGMAGLWTVGGIAVGALGEAGASAVEGGTAGATTPAGYGGGSPGSPVITQPIAQQQTAGPTQINITVQAGTLIGEKQAITRWMEDDFAPAMREAVSRQINFGVVPV